MTGEMVLAALSAVLRIAFQIIPNLKEWWESWKWQQPAWFIGCFVVAGALEALCRSGAAVGFECADPFLFDGLWRVVSAALAAFGAGQAAASAGDFLRARKR